MRDSFQCSNKSEIVLLIIQNVTGRDLVQNAPCWMGNKVIDGRYLGLYDRFQKTILIYGVISVIENSCVPVEVIQ